MREVLATYHFAHGTTSLLQTSHAEVEWQCDCQVFRQCHSRRVPAWCKHVAKAQARRSIERLLRFRSTRPLLGR